MLQYSEFDLDEYFARTKPPTAGSGTVEFWGKMLGVIRAVADLHSFDIPRARVDRKYYEYVHPFVAVETLT
jgi:hypothetical protein